MHFSFLGGSPSADGNVHIEVVATGLAFGHGIPIAVDASIVSPLHADGTPHKDADVRPGTSIIRAERSKSTTYPELVHSSQLRLETVACEIGGRLSYNSQRILDIAAASRARSELDSRQKYMAKWWRNRWVTMLAVAIQSCVVPLSSMMVVLC